MAHRHWSVDEEVNFIIQDLGGSSVTRRASAPDITRRRLSLPADRRAGEAERTGQGTGHRDLQNALQVIQKTIVAMSEPRPPPRTTSISSLPDAGSGTSPKYPGQMERGQMADYEATFMALERENEILKSKLQNAMRREIQALRTSKKLARDNHKLKQVVLKQEEAGHGQQGHLSLPKHAGLSAARCRSPIDMEAPMVVGNGQQQQLPIHHERSNSGDDTLSYPRDDSDSAIVMESDMSQRHPSDSDDTSGSGDDRHLDMSRTRKGQTPARSVSVVIERQRGLSPAGQGNKNIYGQLEITGDRHDVRFPWQRDVATQCDFNADVMCSRCAMVIREEDEGVEKENMSVGQQTVVRRDKSKMQMTRARPASADWSTRYTRTLDNSNFRPPNVARPRLLAEELTDDVQRRRAEAARMSFARRTHLSLDAPSEPLQVVNLREPGQGRRGERPMSDGWADQKVQYGSVPSESLYFPPPSDSPRVVRREAADVRRMRPMSADWSNVSTSWGPPVKPPQTQTGSDPEIRARVFASEVPPMDYQQPESKQLNRATSLPPATFRDQHKQLHGVGVSTVEEEDDGPSADDSSPKRANKGSASPNTDDGSSDDNSVKGTDDDTPRKRRQKRALRRRSSLIVSLPGLQVSPGDLLVCEPGDYHDGQAALAALKDRHRGSAANLLEDEKKTKSAWAFLKTNFTKSKEKDERKKSTALEVALTTIKQRDLGEHHLNAYKDSHWTDLMATTELGLPSLPLTEMEKKRREAVWELFTSECVYLLDHLLILKYVFLEPLLELQEQGHVAFVDTPKLFANLDELCQVSSWFCKELLNNLLNNVTPMEFGSTQAVVNAFNTFGTRVCPPYQRYCLNYSSALSYMVELRKNEDFKEFIQWCEQDPRCNRLKLSDLLVAPMQHLTKFPLLLKDIRKRTEDADDKTSLTATLESVEESIRELEGKVKWLTNFERLQELQELIEFPAIDQETKAYVPEFLRATLMKQSHQNILADPTRQLLYEGSLCMLESGKPVDVYLFLFDDLLLITKMRKNAAKKKQSMDQFPHGSVSSRKTSLMHKDGPVFTVYRQPVPLDRLAIHDVDIPQSVATGLKHAFVLVHENRFQHAAAVLTLQASSEPMKATWLANLNSAKDNWREFLDSQDQQGQDSTTAEEKS
ncbi:uncharacterized protein LOC118415203 isoform X1 [Branchiostoma floridae]|uniref:Uncharacterized protein LOC118415203 isoform X1 n=3 Tax=Branchiostoma floridae TaxID=7739 RepID=A0A9J7MQF3_BRAFL|nr:uncharacterized protein LOC118415203 isoform X1 [Branchiostoma floridae]